MPRFNNLTLTSIVPNLTALLTAHQQRINDILQSIKQFTWANLMQPLEDMEDELERYWSPIAHLHAVMNSSELRSCYQACLPLLSAYASAIGQNHELYLAIESIDQSQLTAAKQQCVTHKLRDFVLSGVALSTQDKQRFEAIETRLSELANKFENNLLDATDAYTLHITDLTKLSGLPEHTIEHATQLAKDKHLSGALLTLDAPCYLAVLTYAHDRTIREDLYQAYVTRASDLGPFAGKFDNSAIMREILMLRREKALLLGFKDYAALSLATKMAKTPTEVHNFLQDLLQRAVPKAHKDFNELVDFAHTLHPEYKELRPWDIAYVSEQQKQACYAFAEETLRPYFPLEHVLTCMFDTMRILYGMTVTKLTDVDVWHADVICYRVWDEQGNVRGDVYLDLFARPQKRSGAWMDSLQSRCYSHDGSVQHPIATLTCNFTNPSAGKPATLLHDEVLTLLHEMGHCLQHILTTVDVLSVAGIHGVEWDAVELPSQFFENWGWEQSALARLAAHVDTHEPLPENLFKAMLAAKNFQSGLAMTRQLLYSVFDFQLHEIDISQDENAILNLLTDLQAKITVTPTVPYNRFPQSFSHIFAGGYAAGYYSYKWAEVLACDAFARFAEEGVFNAETGREFLHAILEVGGSINALDAYINFRKRPPTVDALLQHNGII